MQAADLWLHHNQPAILDSNTATKSKDEGCLKDFSYKLAFLI